MMRDGYELMEMELEGYDGEEMYMASEYKGRPASKQMQIIYETIPLYEETALRFIDRISTEKSKENGGNEHDTNSLENKSFEELMEIVAKNDATISQNKDLMKKALIKRILGQQQKIAEQKKEIARLSEQKVM